MNGYRQGLVAIASLGLLVGCADVGRSAASVSSEDYSPRYDYSQFRAASDGHDFPVLIAGDAFAGVPADVEGPRLIAAMQANKPRPDMTFVASNAAAGHRLVLIFDPVSDLPAGRVCKGDMRSGPHVPGRIVMYAVYCRSDLPMSQAVGRTVAAAPDDPAMGRLFKDVFQTVFSDGQINDPNQAYPGGLQ